MLMVLAFMIDVAAPELQLKQIPRTHITKDTENTEIKQQVNE
jgi:hypothetical protein